MHTIRVACALISTTCVLEGLSLLADKEKPNNSRLFIADQSIVFDSLISIASAILAKVLNHSDCLIKNSLISNTSAKHVLVSQSTETNINKFLILKTDGSTTAKLTLLSYLRLYKMSEGMCKQLNFTLVEPFFVQIESLLLPDKTLTCW